MGKGLLAHWRRRIVARGLAGAILFAVPVAVAAALGFGTSLSGVAGGLSSIAEGPDEITTVDASTSVKLNRAVAAVASRNEAGRSLAGREGSVGDGGATDGGDGASLGGGGGAGGGDGSSGTDTASTISPPEIDIPGGGSGGAGSGDPVGDTVTGTGDTVNGALTGVGNTVNGLLGGGQ